MAPSICGDLVNSKRTFLALGWLIVNALTLISFSSALAFTLLSASAYKNQNQNQDNYYNQDQGEEHRDEGEMEISVTSRAMAFTALWTMVLSSLIGIYGTVILGFVSPWHGTYYWCCRNSVHKTTPMILGSFIGALLMYANLTLVCSVLFGEFKVRDYTEGGGENEDNQDNGEQNLSRSSTVFSILCMFLTILYAGFAALVFTYSADLLRENEEDERQEALKPSDEEESMRGYIGNKFTVQSPNAAGVSDGYYQAHDSASFSGQE